VIDGITGRLVEAGDARVLAAAVLEALEQPGLAARWGEAGQKRFEREFTAARMARQTFAVYEGLLQQNSAASYKFGERSFAAVKMA
jgi:glycosyltransferase involved in cell wall biosynthesis